MTRILLLLLIAFLIYMVIRTLFRSQVKKDDAAPPEASSAQGEEMVACARCGVNVPRSETREQDGRRVCASNPNCK
jgi:uncharacterized protein